MATAVSGENENHGGDPKNNNNCQDRKGRDFELRRGG
jgi:hypothetical protein